MLNSFNEQKISKYYRSREREPRSTLERHCASIDYQQCTYERRSLCFAYYRFNSDCHVYCCILSAQAFFFPCRKLMHLRTLGTVIRPSSTTTLTAHAETTLFSPIAITSTNSSNRQKFVSTPAFLTVWSTSTNSRGAMVTFTQIAANPLANFNGTSSSFDQSG